MYIVLCSFGGPLPFPHCRKLLPSAWSSCEAFYQRNTAETLNSWCCPFHAPLSISITPSLSAVSSTFAALQWMLCLVSTLYTTNEGFSWRVLTVSRLELQDLFGQFWCDLTCLVKKHLIRNGTSWSNNYPNSNLTVDCCVYKYPEKLPVHLQWHMSPNSG